MKTAAVKTIISIALAAVLGVGGYFGTRQILTGGGSAGSYDGSGSSSSGGGSSRENSDPRDNTKYKPVDFDWDEPKENDNESSRFLAGKYVRDDGDAVLYIEYEDSKDYFVFELFAMETENGDELQIEGNADIDGRSALYEQRSRTISFEYVEEGVIEIETDIDDGSAPADGTYYIVRAKYGSTPKPEIRNNTSRDGGGGGGGGGDEDPPPTGGGGQRPPGGGGGGEDPPPTGGGGGGRGETNSTPEGAFRAMVLMMQEEDYSNREISAIYSRSEYDAVVRYYDSDSIMSELYDFREEMAQDLADEWTDELGVDRQRSQQFVRDLFNAVIDWLKAFEYTVDSVEYVSDDSAYVNITVTQRVEFAFDYFMEYTIFELLFTYCDLTTMTEQEIMDWLFELFIDYLCNPADYGDLKYPHESYSIYTFKQADTGWVVDNYDVNNDLLEVFFLTDF